MSAYVGPFCVGDHIHVLDHNAPTDFDMVIGRVTLFRHGDNTRGPLSMGAEVMLPDGRTKFCYIHDMLRWNPGRLAEFMRPLPEAAAAEAAIRLHTAASRLDGKGGDPRVGMAHLLASLHAFAAENGIDFDGLLEDVKAQTGGVTVAAPGR